MSFESGSFMGGRNEGESLGENLLAQNEKIISMPLLTEDGLAFMFKFIEQRTNYFNSCSDEEIQQTLERIDKFITKLKQEATSGQLTFGDEIIYPEDLKKFALYNVLTQEDPSEEVMWLDFDDSRLANFISNGFSERPSVE